MGCFQSTVHRGSTSEDPFFRPNEAALIGEPLPPRSWAAYRAARLRRFRGKGAAEGFRSVRWSLALHGSDGNEGREQGSGDGSGEREGANGGGVERPEGKKWMKLRGPRSKVFLRWFSEPGIPLLLGPSVAAEAASATAAAAAAVVLLLGGVGSKEAKKTATKRGSDEASEGRKRRWRLVQRGKLVGDEASAGKKRKASDDSDRSDSDSDSEGDGEY